MRNLLAALAILPVLGSGGCHHAAAPLTLDEVETGVLYAGMDTNGQSVALKTEQTLRIELESIPTAGYIWAIKDQPDVLELAAEGGRPTDPDVQNQPGFAGGNHYLSFDFMATKAGSGTLNLVEGRPWELEAGEPPTGTYSLTVTVAD